MTVMLPVVQITGSQRFATTFHYCKSHRCKKITFFTLVTFLRFLTFFYFPNVFLFLKNVGKVQSGKQINKKHFQNNSDERDL